MAFKVKRTAAQGFANSVVNSPEQAEALPLRIPFAVVAHGAFPRADRGRASVVSFCSCCAWCISAGNAPCATTAKNLSGRRRRPCSRTICSVEREYCPTVYEALYSNVQKDCTEQMRGRKKVLRVQLNRIIILIPCYPYSETEG